MPKIRAAVCREFLAPLEIEEIELADPGPGELEVRLAACAICHSDISYAEGAWGGYLPAVYGHEAAGHVSRVGPGVLDYAEGDRVLVTFLRSCGTCPSCATGHPGTCQKPRNYHAGPLSLGDGTPVEQGLGSGCFAERVVVEPSQIVKLPDDIPLDVASTLACGVITGVGAVVNTAGLRPGQSCVVIGAGGVGLNAIQGARLAGAARIVAVDMTEEKLAIAREFGATDGVLTGELVDYEPGIVSAIGQQMLGSKMGDVVLARDIPWLVDLYRQGRLKLDELVSARWRLEQINEAIADTNSGAAKRNVIVFD
jgi:S-(hydroxymethyl)glutathione dehydrogenase/alcohol dehydrogenase